MLHPWVLILLQYWVSLFFLKFSKKLFYQSIINVVQHLLLLFDFENLCTDILILESKSPKPLKFTNLFFSSPQESLYLPVSTSHIALPTNLPIAGLPVGTPLAFPLCSRSPGTHPTLSVEDSCSSLRTLKLLTWSLSNSGLHWNGRFIKTKKVSISRLLSFFFLLNVNFILECSWLTMLH